MECYDRHMGWLQVLLQRLTNRRVDEPADASHEGAHLRPLPPTAGTRPIERPPATAGTRPLEGPRPTAGTRTFRSPGGTPSTQRIHNPPRPGR